MRHIMTQATRNTISQTKLIIAAFFAVAALSLFAAAPAKAGGNEFDDGFQDELGRLVAGEVFHLGKWVLAGGPHGAHYAYAEPAHYRPRYERRHARKHRKIRRWEHRHYWRQHYGHHHGYREPCRYRGRDRHARHEGRQGRHQ